MASYTPNHNLYKPAGTDQFDNFLTEFGNNMDVIDSNLGGGGGSSTLAGLSDVNLTSPVTNDALIYDGAEWVNSPLSAVAFSGDYSDLSNAPTIPTKTSDLNNDSDFVSDASYVHTDNNFTNADVTKLSGIQAGAEVNVQSDWNEADNTADDYIKNKPTIPTNTSDLNNDSGFLDSSDITVTQVQTTGTKIATIDVDGNSTDLYAPTGGGGSYTEGDGIDITSNTISVDTTFTEASTRTNINSGDTFSTILGKIKKWFTDLPSMFVSKSGDRMSGDLTIIRADGTTTTVGNSTLTLGNNIQEGTAGNSRGYILMYGKTDKRVVIRDNNTNGFTANREINIPDKSGTLALTDDIPEISVTLLSSNMYLSTADTWVSVFLSNTSLDDFDFIGFGWHRVDNPSNWNQIDTIVPTSVFKASTHSNPCYVLDDPYSSADDTRCVKVAYSPLNHYIDTYRGNAVWAFRRLAVFGIKIS